MPMTMFVIVGAVAVVLFMLVSAAVKIVQEYERGVIFRLGRLVDARGPGFFLLIPFVETMRKVDLRIVTLEVPAQEAITRDNVTIQVDAVVYFRVLNPSDAVVKAIDFVRATSLVGQTTLRSCATCKRSPRSPLRRTARSSFRCRSTSSSCCSRVADHRSARTMRPRTETSHVLRPRCECRGTGARISARALCCWTGRRLEFAAPTPN